MGLYLAPPENAVVVYVDEKPQIQALGRTRPVLPMRPGIPERHTHDYIRHGTTTLFAALEAATGTVTDACYPRRRYGEFLCLLKKVAAAYPGEELHVVCDNYATHKHAEVRTWLARPQNQRITLHFVPDQLLLAEPGGMLLLGYHPPGHPPRHLRLRQPAHIGHRRLHRSLEPAPPAVHLDQGRRPDPRQHPARQD